MKRVRYITCFNYQYRNNNFYFEQFSYSILSIQNSKSSPGNTEAVYCERSVNNIGFHQGSYSESNYSLELIRPWREIIDRNQRNKKTETCLDCVSKFILTPRSKYTTCESTIKRDKSADLLLDDDQPSLPGSGA